MNETMNPNASQSDDLDWASLGYLANDDLEIPEDKLNKKDIGRSFYQLGKLFYDKSDLVQAEKNFVKAYQCAERPQDTFSILKILGFLI